MNIQDCGPIAVSVEEGQMKFTVLGENGFYYHLRFPASDGLRIIEDMKACLYQIAAMEDEEG